MFTHEVHELKSRMKFSIYNCLYLDALVKGVVPLLRNQLKQPFLIKFCSSLEPSKRRTKYDYKRLLYLKGSSERFYYKKAASKGFPISGQ
jgi:hypothetical protein